VSCDYFDCRKCKRYKYNFNFNEDRCLESEPTGCNIVTGKMYAKYSYCDRRSVGGRETADT
jgi:hypothetical protein